MWTPNTVVGGVSESAEHFQPVVHFDLYGLGWFLGDSGAQGRHAQRRPRRHDLARRAAARRELGVVVLTNGATPLQSVPLCRVFDIFFGRAPAGLERRLHGARQGAKRARRRRGEEARRRARLEHEALARALLSTRGHTRGTMYGDARVTEENGRLVLRLLPSPDFVGDLDAGTSTRSEPKLRESVVYPSPRAWSPSLDPQGKISEMNGRADPDFDFKELEFKRAAGARAAAGN